MEFRPRTVSLTYLVGSGNALLTSTASVLDHPLNAFEPHLRRSPYSSTPHAARRPLHYHVVVLKLSFPPATSQLTTSRGLELEYIILASILQCRFLTYPALWKITNNVNNHNTDPTRGRVPAKKVLGRYLSSHLVPIHRSTFEWK